MKTPARMRRRRKVQNDNALGAPRHVHAERGETARAHVQYALGKAHGDMDMAEKGDVYSCSSALHMIVSAASADGAARAEHRARMKEPSETEFREIRKAMERYRNVCQARKHR